MSKPVVKRLLDTGYCVYMIRTQAHHLALRFEAFAPGEIAVSSITVAKLQAYAETTENPARNRQALEQFLLPLVVADFDAEAARRLAWRGAQGHMHADVHAALLAAHALRLNAVLVARRPELYAGIAGLQVQTAVDEGTHMPADEAPIAAPLPTAPRPAPGARRTIVMTGSHDLSLDLLADWLHHSHPEYVLAAAHVGSTAGLLALRQHEAHLAGAHLLDETTGDFNISHVRRLLTDQGEHVVVIAFVRRVQGLIVAPGNPKQLASLEDLLRPDVRFVNRQPGAGTRVLLDFHLQQARIDPAAVNGYDVASPTHLAVASAVARGHADCGLGIQAAAQAFHLDFMPLCEERFDLVIPQVIYTSGLLAPLLALLRNRSAGFPAAVEALGGYRTDQMGTVLAEL